MGNREHLALLNIKPNVTAIAALFYLQNFLKCISTAYLPNVFTTQHDLPKNNPKFWTLVGWTYNCIVKKKKIEKFLWCVNHV